MEPVRNPHGVSLALEAACRAHPEQRVMQLIVNALGNDPYYVEDNDAVDALYEYARKVR